MRAAISLVLPEHLVAHYEVLRANALGTALAAGWAGRCFCTSECLPGAKPGKRWRPHPPPQRCFPHPPTPVLDIDPEVVCILAGMVLAVHQEVNYGD